MVVWAHASAQGLGFAAIATRELELVALAAGLTAGHHGPGLATSTARRSETRVTRIPSQPDLLSVTTAPTRPR